MELNIYQVDAFSDKAFGGNPAGVVLDAKYLTEDIMQNIAKEMNLSETAFVTSREDDLFTVRFFTTVCEVDLCGHATIATFYTLAKMGYITSIADGVKTVYQDTKAGKLSVDIIFKNGKVDKIFMEQATPKKIGSISDISPLIESMGININEVGVSDDIIYPEIISTGLPDIILPIKKKEVLDKLDIDMKTLAKISQDLGVTGVHAFHLPEINSSVVYTRNFAPLVGIDEEAATGTSNGALIYFLKKNNLIEDNNIISYQGQSMNRPSTIYCEIIEKNEKSVVKIGGNAKIVINGVISI
ncbi:PhzF family phenazine biosynthesis protein [Tissierella carlieri]|jgi:PhzF family phenazine biosynthesis protein|uniref:PhzF family phenazine biosynthesis protein n=1 Tax=Tissierella TaxID=41273 RepID=UPI002803F5AD|nr:PhzF family phenazine biosynthesis protein [uncultured Tissierella sp.]MDU5082907.1 PhzF family phenazine biosynthesis protein [Bacillota bacterium]